MLKTALVAVVLALGVSAAALPHVKPQGRLAQRDVQVLGVRYVPAQAPEIAVRGEHYKDVERRDVIPEEVPTKGDKGVITPYQKRQSIPAEIAVKTDANGNVVPYEKRQNIPAEIAVKTDANGNVVPYEKRQNIPAEIAVKTDANGNVVPYEKRDEDDHYN